MSAEEKTYYLWLDESGDFEEDPVKKKAPPSLVGGVFCDESVRKKLRPKDALNLVALDPAFQPAFGGAPPAVHHCAELPSDVKVPARLQVIKWCAEQNLQFVFFQNRSKIRIIDTTLTYLNFLAEGLAQLMAHLSVESSAKLKVIIGRRVDVAALDRDPASGLQVIPPEEYLSRIAERIAIAKARYLFDGTNQVTCEISFDSDKRNNFLVLSDYACSCRYTLDYSAGPTWRDYEKRTPDGRKRRDVLEDIFSRRSMNFGLLEDRLQHDVRRSLSNRDWGGALFLALSRGEPAREMEDELHAVFKTFDSQNQRTQMTMFFHLVSHLLHAKDDRNVIIDGSEEVIRQLEAYLPQLERLPFQDENLKPFCRMNAWLYLSAAYTHCGRTGQANTLLEQCETLLPELLRQPENLNLYYILRNRQAIICQDCYQYQKALDLLDEALSAVELQRESQKQLFSLLDYPVEDLPSEQQAKLLGSRALTFQYMLPIHPELAEEARAAARQTIEAFRFPSDKRRHHMTMAEIELRCGQLDTAYQEFCAGLGCAGEDLLDALEKCESPFDWYHAIRLADGLCQGDAKQKSLARKIFDLIRKRFKTIFKRAYPAHSAARRAGMLCLKLGGDADFAQQCFLKCETLCFHPEKETLWSIGLASLADRIAAELRAGKPHAAVLEKRFRKHCAEAEAHTQLPALKEFYHSLNCRSGALQDGPQKEKFYQAFSDQVGI